MAGRHEELRSRFVDGDLVAVTNLDGVDGVIAEIANAGRHGVVLYKGRAAGQRSGEERASLERGVTERDELVLNPLKLRGNSGTISVGKRAVRAFYAQSERPLHDQDYRVESRIGRLKFALDGSKALQVARVECYLIVILNENRSGGRIVRRLIHSAAGRQFEQRIFGVLTGAVERSQQVRHGIGIHAQDITSRGSRRCRAAS